MAVPSALASTSSRGPLPGANLHDVVPGAPGRSVTITRDAFGVPHVSAPSAEAAAYGVGYVLATDRLFETDVIRKLGQGRLSEILGPGPDDATLVTDQEMRREFYDRADIERQYRSLPPNIQRLLRAYAEGFNAALVAQQANPVERSVVFTALGYEPELWRPEDSLTVLMLFTTVNLAGEGGAGELSNAALLADLVGKHGREAGLRIWNDLLLPNDPDAPAVVPRGAVGGRSCFDVPPSGADRAGTGPWQRVCRRRQGPRGSCRQGPPNPGPTAGAQDRQLCAGGDGRTDKEWERSFARITPGGLFGTVGVL